MRNIVILGSTGSIGTQALEVVRKSNDEFKVIAISGNKNIDLLYKQAVEFKPSYIVVMDELNAKELKEKLRTTDIKILVGINGLEEISAIDEADIILNSVVGMVGLKPTIAAIRANKTIALANKETLVVAGDIIKEELKNSKASIIPVDSEHNAIFQCLLGNDKTKVNRLIITASGGPFRGKTKEDLKNVTDKEALKHPRWSMGKKISIDSSTLMNKGLEVIEAHYLFDIPYEKIDVVVHPQSIIHSMVEYVDGSIIAQLGKTDMGHPIQFALNYPERQESTVGYLNLLEFNNLTFEKPDLETFECLKLAYEAGITGGTMTTVLNAVNEEAVAQFLAGRIKYLDISQIIKEAMKSHIVEYDVSIDRIIELENKYRLFVRELIDR